jgi:hypothetical protein
LPLSYDVIINGTCVCCIDRHTVNDDTMTIALWESFKSNHGRFVVLVFIHLTFQLLRQIFVYVVDPITRFARRSVERRRARDNVEMFTIVGRWKMDVMQVGKNTPTHIWTRRCS